MQAAGTTGAAGTTRPSLRDGLHVYTQSPWCTGLSGHHSRQRACARCAGHQHRGVRTLRLHVRALPFVRVHRARCGTSRPSLPASRVVTIARNAPPCRGGMRAVKHDFRKNERHISEFTKRCEHSDGTTDRRSGAARSRCRPFLAPLNRAIASPLTSISLEYTHLAHLSEEPRPNPPVVTDLPQIPDRRPHCTFAESRSNAEKSINLFQIQ